MSYYAHPVVSPIVRSVLFKGILRCLATSQDHDLRATRKPPVKCGPTKGAFGVKPHLCGAHREETTKRLCDYFPCTHKTGTLLRQTREFEKLDRICRENSRRHKPTHKSGLTDPATTSVPTNPPIAPACDTRLVYMQNQLET